MRSGYSLEGCGARGFSRGWVVAGRILVRGSISFREV